MRLGKPIYNNNGVLLYDRDTKLSIQAIYGIKNFSLMGLYILEPAEPVPPLTEDDINFERFQTMSVFSIREDLDLIASGKKDKGLDWLCSLIIRNYGNLDRKINFVQSLRSEEDFVYKHVLNVAILTALMAGQMKITGARLNMLIKAAVLHDIGALKAKQLFEQQELDHDQKQMIWKNTQDILHAYSALDPDIVRLINQMQELYVNEGERIPENLKINPNANILYIADSFDRMTAMKSYKEPTSEVLAIRTMTEDEERYNPQIVNSLIRAINVLYPGVCVELTNGEKGLVLRENEENLFQPLVLYFRDNTFCDLSDPDVHRQVQIADVMKTMDNRIQLDHSLLEEYSGHSN